MREVELLAPAGDLNAAKAAIIAGADAIYCGLNKYNARNRAENIEFDDLLGLIRLAHAHQCKVFLTLNILVLDAEIPELITLLNRLVNTQIDGIIVQDLGLLYLLRKHFSSLDAHASTQLTTHNEGQIDFLHHLNVSRVNLSRELNLKEIAHLSSFAQKHSMLTEVFVHGSYCISFSGICYMSSLQNGKSGNRGRCSQPCRKRYMSTEMQKNFPLNLKDNSAFDNLKELYEAGVSSLKIEGRIKDYTYVYPVVATWRKQLQRLYAHRPLSSDHTELYKVFNRDFTNGFLMDRLHKDMFIDNPMSNSSTHHSKVNSHLSSPDKEKGLQQLFAEKDLEQAAIKEQIDRLSTQKTAIQLSLSGKAGMPLSVQISTKENTFQLKTDELLSSKGRATLTEQMVLKRLQAFDDTAYELRDLSLDHLEGKLSISYKALTKLKTQLLSYLNGGQEHHAPLTLAKLPKQNPIEKTPQLSVLISSKEDLPLLEESTAHIYFRLPNDLHTQLDELVAMFTSHPLLLPWFPSILIEDDYRAAVSFLDQVRPQHIVSNNTGVAFAAFERNIAWLAGPQMNLVNSYSMHCLKELFNCSGAYVSNEIKKGQIQQLKCPEHFTLHYSIYHPIVLMTSRQCLMHQVSGCEKHKMDNTCIKDCKRLSHIKDLSGQLFLIEKSKGNYHRVVNAQNYLNTTVAKDFEGFFSHFLIDLSEIQTETEIILDKPELIDAFQNHIHRSATSENTLQSTILHTTCKQYQKGI